MLSEATTVKERLLTPHGELELQQHHEESNTQWDIIQDGSYICSSKRGRSSVGLVNFGLEALNVQNDLKVLIGGLGLGYSLRAALQSPQVVEVDVVEWEKAIIGWHLRFLGDYARKALMDSRTRLITENILVALPGIQRKYNLIAIDIDSGPRDFTHPQNAELYSVDFLSVLRGHLKKDGVLTIWSDSYEESFRNLLESLFSKVDVCRVLDHDSSDGHLEAFIYRAAV